MKVDIDIEKLKILLNNGLSIKEISKEFEVNISTIKRRMLKNELKSKFSLMKNERVVCLNCGQDFTSLKNENRKFCSQSCSTTLNNIKRNKKLIEIENKKIKIKKVRKNKNVGKCLNCEIEINRDNGKNYQKYCSNICQVKYEEKIKFEKVENNESTSIVSIKKYLIKKYGNKCMECGWCETNKTSNKIPIELEHIDGNSENNNLENLKLLCPNCHSLTPTYKALNRGNGRHKRMERYNEEKSY